MLGYPCKMDEIRRITDKFYENSFKLSVWYNEEDIDIVLKYCEILKKVSNYYKKEGTK